jgi:hypothetical protein
VAVLAKHRGTPAGKNATGWVMNHGDGTCMLAVLFVIAL